MGFLRLWLALVVASAHLARYLHIGSYLQPYLAVQVFYVISGFYMQLLIVEGQKPSSRRVGAFYLSRALRIYPLYFVALALAEFTTAIWPPSALLDPSSPQSFIHHASGFTLATVAVTNLLIFGQDILRFFAYDPSTGGLRLSLTFPMHPYGDWAFFLNLVAQSWSLALELCFYLLAPFVLWRRTSAVVSIIAASVCLRIIGYIAGLDENVNFVFAAFPFEIATFLCGAVAYRAYHRYSDQLRSSIVAPAILAIIALFGFAYSSMPGVNVGSIKYWGFLAAVAIALPFLFAWSANSKLDRFIGELSFPVYLLHISVFYLVGRFVPPSVGRLLVPVAIVTVAITVYVFFQRPVDRARHRLAQAVIQRRSAVSSSRSPNDMVPVSGDPVSQ